MPMPIPLSIAFWWAWWQISVPDGHSDVEWGDPCPVPHSHTIDEHCVQVLAWSVHCALCIVHCALYIVNCALRIVHCELCIVHCALWIVHCALCIVHCALCIVHWELQCVVCNVKWSLCSYLKHILLWPDTILYSRSNRMGLAILKILIILLSSEWWIKIILKTRRNISWTKRLDQMFRNVLI